MSPPAPPAPLPRSLRGHFAFDEHALVAVKHSPLPAAVLFGAAVVAGLGAAFGVGPLAAIALVITGAFVLTFAVAHEDEASIGRVDADGVVLGGRRLACDRVVLEGEPGGLVTLSIRGTSGRHVLLDRRPDARWTLDAMRWMARQIAERTGATLEDHLDRERWELWRTDAATRAQIDFERRIDASLDARPTLHAVEPRQPEDAIVEIDRIRWGNLVLDTHRVSGRRTLELSEVLAIDVAFDPPAAIFVRTPQAVVALARLEPSENDAAHARWFVEQVRDAVARHHPPGSRADVPEALRHVSAWSTDVPGDSSSRR